MRVIMSEIGSVILSSLSTTNARFPTPNWELAFGGWQFPLPGALGHARDIAFEGQLAEAEAAHVELANVGARTAAQLAPVAVTDLELERLRFLGDLRGGSHLRP